MILTVLLAALLLLALFLNYKQTQRHDERIDRLLLLTAEERRHAEHKRQQYLEVLRKPHPDIKELIDLVDRVCQRLQAPEQAVVEHAMNQPLPDLPQAILPDDDEGWHQAQGIPKEQLAEELMEAELNA